MAIDESIQPIQLKSRRTNNLAMSRTEQPQPSRAAEGKANLRPYQPISLDIFNQRSAGGGRSQGGVNDRFGPD